MGYWVLGIGHWALVLSVRVASRREVEVLGIGHWEENLVPSTLLG
ncbi:hypothetical protein [Nostoc sp.]